MSIRPIVPITDPLLREKSAQILDYDGALSALARDMIETMHDAPGAGIAAIQIGVPKRIIVVDLREYLGMQTDLILVNPTIKTRSPEKICIEEGCLSIPNYYASVDRSDSIRIEYNDLDGAEKEMELSGISSIIIQHEIDHLHGIVFLDYLSRIKREIALRKARKYLKTENILA